MSNMIPHNTVYGYKPYLPSAIRAVSEYSKLQARARRRRKGKRSYAHAHNNGASAVKILS